MDLEIMGYEKKVISCSHEIGLQVVFQQSER